MICFHYLRVIDTALFDGQWISSGSCTSEKFGKVSSVSTLKCSRMVTEKSNAKCSVTGLNMEGGKLPQLVIPKIKERMLGKLFFYNLIGSTIHRLGEENGAIKSSGSFNTYEKTIQWNQLQSQFLGTCNERWEKSGMK